MYNRTVTVNDNILNMKHDNEDTGDAVWWYLFGLFLRTGDKHTWWWEQSCKQWWKTRRHSSKDVHFIRCIQISVLYDRTRVASPPKTNKKRKEWKHINDHYHQKGRWIPEFWGFFCFCFVFEVRIFQSRSSELPIAHPQPPSLPPRPIFHFQTPCSPWYNRYGWLGIKHQVTYLL